MGDDVTVNGFKLPVTVLLGILTVTFWLGGLSWAVTGMAEDQKKHETAPAHTEAGIATTKIQADVEHNKEAIEEVKEDLKEIKAQMAADKGEILDAIREE